MTLKTNTASDTKDKMGKAWPALNSALRANEDSIDEATKRTCGSDLLTFVHFVDEETSRKRSNGTTSSYLRNETMAEDECASDTSEEEFDDVGHIKRRVCASQMTAFDNSLDSEEDEVEFS